MAIKPLSEASIQADFFEWVDLHALRYPELALIYAIPNEGNRSRLDGWKRKLTGRRAGVPDTHLPLPGQINDVNYIGLFIEFKSAKGKVSDKQQQWINTLRSVGHYVAVCRSWPFAANLIIDYLSLPLKKF